MADFESKKNIKATAYTAILLGLIIMLFFVVSWSTPPVVENILDEGLEVNLGNSETGLGDIQPLIPDAPASSEVALATPPPTKSITTPEIKDIETNDDDKDAPPVVIKKSLSIPTKKSTPTKVAEPIKVKTVVENKPVETPPVPAPTPKILYKSPTGQGKGGNNADSYQKSNGQGITSGTGDQGKLNGNPNSDNYNGSGGNGNGGVTISRGLQGRKINRFPSFEDDFQENAKVAVDITVDSRGKVINATFQQKGSTTANSSIKNIALKKARQLQFNVDEQDLQDQIGTIIFNFRIRN
jgi:hypothetical protein